LNAWINDLQLALLPCSLLTAVIMRATYPYQLGGVVVYNYDISYDIMTYIYGTDMMC